jgi:acetoacetyl-CoA synthetase
MPLLSAWCMNRPTSQLAAFVAHVASRHQVEFSDYDGLHRWCCEHPGAFWQCWLEYCDLPLSGATAPALTGEGFLDRAFFPEVKLNYARCLLGGMASSNENDPAVTVADESGAVHTLTRGQLQERVLAIAAALHKMGVQPGDRVVAIARNSIESIAACLGSAAIGACWSSVSPELGVTAVVERFQQLSPRLLFANSVYCVNGTTRSVSETLSEVVELIPSIEQLVMLDPTDPLPSVRGEITALDQLMAQAPLTLESLVDFPFDHPLFVMFSSGTTGKPKCIVHGAGGTLLEHLKEHRLHSDLSTDDTLLFQTSTGWMMWNWQLSALASGTHIVLYDGSVSYPEKWQLLKCIDDFGVSVFGTSPAYIQYLIESGIQPLSQFRFKALRAIQSTGSVLYESQFNWIAEHFRNVPVQSVSGGTDMIGCLVLGHPDMPVVCGDSQCLSLGIDVQVYTDDGPARDGSGELVVTQPFPSQPVFFWNDENREKITASYFAAHPGLWTHGDQIRITPNGSPRILGRSDGTLNIRGVRIGPAEILTVVNQVDGIKEAMVIEQQSPREPGGSRLVLLLVMRSEKPLAREFVLQLKKRIAAATSRLHVPAIVVKVSALPRTHNGKLSEKAARDAVNRVSITNQSALANPAVLDQIAQLVPQAPS